MGACGPGRRRPRPQRLSGRPPINPLWRPAPHHPSRPYGAKGVKSSVFVVPTVSSSSPRTASLR
jgi:hypothetical protein